MDTVFYILQIIEQNIAGIFSSLVVYIYMRHRLTEEKQKSFEEGKAALKEENSKQEAHLEKMRNEFNDTFNNANRQQDHVFRHGIAEGIAWERRCNWKELDRDYLFRAMDDIGPEYNFFARFPDSKIFKEEYCYKYGYDDLKHIKDASNALEYAFKAGVIEGAVFEYDLRGEVCDYEKVYLAMKESGFYGHFRRDPFKVRCIDSIIEDYSDWLND